LRIPSREDADQASRDIQKSDDLIKASGGLPSKAPKLTGLGLEAVDLGLAEDVSKLETQVLHEKQQLRGV
jgi:hypothetical protein